MASGGRSDRPDRPGQGRAYHQDYIARIRYSNTLPPPSNPPKLLDIPGTGLDLDHYASPSFTARMAREQRLNIEADAELGMPIDLVGIPGVFDGDESAIMAQDPPPPLHPADRALLKPLSALGKPAANNAGVSFLRRTEYISSNATAIQRFESSTSKDLLRVRNDPKRAKKQPVDRNDPLNIIRNHLKGFDLAYPHDTYKGPDTTTAIRGAPITDAEKQAWANPKHPTKSHLTVLDSYPLQPDLEALPVTDGYSVFKFATNPAPESGKYDQRLDTAFLRPVGADVATYEERMANHKADPSLPEPLPDYDYDLFLVDSESSVPEIKRQFDVNAPHTSDSPHFQYDRVREYETYQQAGAAKDPYADTVALALHDADDGSRAASFYPVKSRTQLRSKRKTPGVSQEDRAAPIDRIDAVVRDQDEEEAKMRAAEQAKLEPSMET